jgi:NAD(P)-dependent dehydrogenase (short-subunit alcohol dehydrogenase family)
MKNGLAASYFGSLGVPFFRGKVALVTGSARGIGRSIAAGLGSSGAKVAIADIDFDSAARTVRELRSAGVDAEPFFVDLRESGAPARLVEDVAERLGTLNILVNNARGGARRGEEKDTEFDWEVTSKVCLQAAHFATKAALGVMKHGGGGAVVNISSVSAAFVSTESAAYHAAKAGLSHLTRYLAVTAGPFNVRVNSILPGFIVQDEHLERFYSVENQAFRSRAEKCHPSTRVGYSSDVTDAVIFLCSDAARFINGQNIAVDGGLNLRDSWALTSSLAEGVFEK